ncbi:hypothetical protein SEUCBS139899_010103 [Sporothrix eucalyptigena]|uniref:Uncharacterized protein n=1 Tax=Sporothrix eucalyptigena TaxID=1812306 RepID=A0ABP0CGQ2_9PEZI
MDVVPTADDVDTSKAAAEEGAEKAAEETEAENGEAAEVAEVEVEVAKVEIPKRTSFAAYLKSPVMTLDFGGGEDSENKKHGRRGDYFMRKLPGHAHAFESGPSLPSVDKSGDQLLKHARVYPLAETLGLADLQALTPFKIHCVQSTAQGEIAYARYVCACTKPDDTTVRHPVAKFWATRSHTLRAESEKEAQAPCLEHPQFAYDVLTCVLNEKLRRERDDRLYSAVSESVTRSPTTGSERKRARNSSSVR